MMARFFRIAVFMACFLSAGSAFAAGGSCNSIPVPSGVTSCFYISAAGADTNSGTSESTPWLHAPGMANCSSTCASTTPTAGEGFIFRGGDTWHFGNSSASPYAGAVAGCTGNGTISGGLCLSGSDWTGTSSNPIYVGVDQTWFSGGSWSRPILTGDNPLTPNPGVFKDFVASCTYQIGANNNFIVLNNSSYVILDNFEVTGVCGQTPNAPGNYDRIVSMSADTNNIVERLYIHGWTHLQFTASGGTCTGQCFNLTAFAGGPTDQLLQNVVDGSDSDPGGLQVLFGGGYVTAQNVFRYTAQIVTTTAHLIHDNIFEHWYQPSDINAHGNLLESSGEFNGTNATYNNVFRNICSDPGSCPSSIVGYWPEPHVGQTDYFFNNVYYGVTGSGGVELFNIGQNGGNNQGPLVIFNNTFESGSASYSMMNCGTKSSGAYMVTFANNHYIYDGSTPYGPLCASHETAGSPFTDLVMTHATATANGYTTSKTYAYSPMSSSSPKVGVGTNGHGFCTALSAAGLSDAATACQSDTGYACTYISSNHSVNCPARPVISRPASLAWDRGAYQSGGTQGSGPTPPANLAATVQ